MDVGYYVGKYITQLPHLLPIIDRLPGVVYTDCLDVVVWMSKYRPNNKVKLTKIEDIPPCNIILADFFKFPKTFNSFQIYHGVSEKTYWHHLKNKMPWYNYTINPSPLFLVPTKDQGFSRLNAKKTFGYLALHPRSLPHLVEIYKKFPGNIYTNKKQVYEWLVKFKYKVIWHNKIDLVSMIEKNKEDNIFVFEGFYPLILKRLKKITNTIQLFHGTSEKTIVLAKDGSVDLSNRNFYSKVISSSEILTNMITIKHDKSEPPRALILKKKKVLYMPTHHNGEESSKDVIEEVLSLKEKYDLTIKFHPITYDKDLDLVNKARASGVRVVDPLDYEYVCYEELFYETDLLIADYSSVIYEFTLYSKPILLLPIKEDLQKKIKVAKYCTHYDGNILSSTEVALEGNREYPNYFYKNDIVEVIKKNIK